MPRWCLPLHRFVSIYHPLYAEPLNLYANLNWNSYAASKILIYILLSEKVRKFEQILGYSLHSKQLPRGPAKRKSTSP